MTPAIVVTNLAKHYGSTRAVDGLSFTVPAGTVVGCIGPNGAGKSTTIGCLTGLLDPTAGSVHLLGEPFSSDAVGVKRRIGVMPEDLALFDYLDAREFLAIHAEGYGVARTDAGRRADELLTVLELGDHRRARIGGFSAGMRKRLAFAAAVITAPDLLFLDEPFESVDPAGVALMKSWIRRFAGDGRTVFMTTHMLDAADHLCDRVVFIANGGRLLWEGDVSAFAHGGSIDVDGTPVSSLEQLYLAKSGRTAASAPDWLTR